MSRLSKKQKNSVEKLLAKDHSLRSIATKMGVAYQTLQYHRRRAGAALLRPARTSGEHHASWRGGSFLDRYGYRMVLSPESGRASKYVPEHILVVEQSLGRRLIRGDVVHHIDCDKTNNEISNLIVLSRKEHKKLHAQLEAIAVEMLRDGMVQWNGSGYEAVA